MSQELDHPNFSLLNEVLIQLHDNLGRFDKLYSSTVRHPLVDAVQYSSIVYKYPEVSLVLFMWKLQITLRRHPKERC